MPYASEKQRRFMYAKHPEIAKRWDEEGKNYVKGDKPPEKKTKPTNPGAKPVAKNKPMTKAEKDAAAAAERKRVDEWMAKRDKEMRSGKTKPQPKKPNPTKQAQARRTAAFGKKAKDLLAALGWKDE